MDKIDKITKEIQRLKKELVGYSAQEALDYIESFINLLTKEPQGLDEAAEKWYDSVKCKSDLSGNVLNASEQALAYIKENHSPSEVSDFQAAMNIAVMKAFDAGKEKMREQMMKNATEVTVKVDAGGYSYINAIELYDYDKDIPLAKEGDKYKVILIKED